MTGAVLDAGALIGFERNDRRVVAIVKRAVQRGDRLVVPAAVLGQVWRDGRRQARLATLLSSKACTIDGLDGTTARQVGHLLGTSGTTDVVNASVIVSARQHRVRVITSDGDDLGRIDPSVELVVV